MVPIFPIYVLKGYGSREWLQGFLDADTILTTRYWGGTAHSEGDMVGWLGDHMPDTDEEKATRRNVVLALSAQAALPSQAAMDKKDSAQIAMGIARVDGGVRERPVTPALLRARQRSHAVVRHREEPQSARDRDGGGLDPAGVVSAKSGGGPQVGYPVSPRRIGGVTPMPHTVE